ncbi:uncharacterized protein PAC_02300 [Phialocephala subalpina]|uniref:Uncharacterized protein n=1 Tax=Phialocephala subalpina TaxID=576137 RepID=A0A1L7WI23_9HELO|nr:uncharacterized protein PAC_02300 [Phialocephala subalpina]
MTPDTGSIILPFCQHTPTFRPGSPHWPVCQQLMDVVQNAISSLGVCFAAFQPEAHAAAKQYLRDLANDPANAGTIIHNHLATTHGSPWSAVTLVGQFTRGQIQIPLLVANGHTNVIHGQPGDVLVVRDGVDVGNASFVGERYQLESFLPPIDMKSWIREAKMREQVDKLYQGGGKGGGGSGGNGGGMSGNKKGEDSGKGARRDGR